MTLNSVRLITDQANRISYTRSDFGVLKDLLVAAYFIEEVIMITLAAGGAPMAQTFASVVYFLCHEFH